MLNVFMISLLPHFLPCGDVLLALGLQLLELLLPRRGLFRLAGGGDALLLHGGLLASAQLVLFLVPIRLHSIDMLTEHHRPRLVCIVLRLRPAVRLLRPLHHLVVLLLQQPRPLRCLGIHMAELPVFLLLSLLLLGLQRALARFQVLGLAVLRPFLALGYAGVALGFKGLDALALRLLVLPGGKLFVALAAAGRFQARFTLHPLASVFLHDIRDLALLTCLALQLQLRDPRLPLLIVG
mmetsp:Transcript_2460/g.5621  ORF Transcript_2460/g.5621 Transcript_2460/m.5621 type:complete len:238 (+) Transcript_2460:417-1130(+)